MAWKCIICLLAASPFLVHAIRSVAASGEQYSINVSPTWAHEGAPSGVQIVLLVSNAQLGPYTFNWTITDPSGKSTSVNMNTLSTTSSWNQTTSYPASFAGNLNLAGLYSIHIGEILPSSNSSVESGTFQVGLTDNRTYDRNSTVQLTAAGYLPLDHVNVTLTHAGIPVAGFPAIKNATATGSFSFSWPTRSNTTLGAYTVQLKGMSTPKNPPDAQVFTVYPTNTTTAILSVSTGIASRSQTLQFAFNATYLDGQPATSGSGRILVTEPDSTTNHQITATYDAAAKEFTALYLTALSSTTGLWSAKLDAASYDDGNGNGGPSAPVSTSFVLQPASLNITSQPYSSAFGSGGVIVFSSRVLTPSGVSFSQGSVAATLTYAGLTVAGPIYLVYDPSLGRWTGSYLVGKNDPSGTWILTLIGSDPWGNSGRAQAFVIVSTSGTQSQAPLDLPTWVWLAAILAMIGTGFGILIFKRRNVMHQKVKLDLEAIHRKANEVKSSDFLQSIQAQLNRRSERMAKEKEQMKSD